MPSAPSGNIVYQQPWIQTGDEWSSQNDPNLFHNFAADYDNFTLATTTTLTGVYWVGGYLNPSVQGQITQWDVKFYSDNAGQPGTVVSDTGIPGTSGETFLGNFLDSNGVSHPMFSYFANINFQVNAGIQYWLSLVPTMIFPPQWGWAIGTGGDGFFYQDFFGSRTKINNDLAFTLFAGGTGPPPSGQSAFFKIQKLVVSVKQDNIPVRGRNK